MAILNKLQNNIHQITNIIQMSSMQVYHFIIRRQPDGTVSIVPTFTREGEIHIRARVLPREQETTLSSRTPVVETTQGFTTFWLLWDALDINRFKKL